MTKGSLQKLASWKQLAAVCIVIFLFVVFFFRNVYSQKTEANRGLRVKINELKAEKKSLESFVKALSQQGTADTLATLKKSPDIKLQILTGEKQAAFSTIAPLLAIVSSSSFREGIQVDAVSHLPPKLETGFEQVGYDMTAHGSFEGILSFIDKIIKLESLVSIESISLSLFKEPPSEKAKKEEKTLEVQLDLKGSLYRLRPEVGQEATASSS